MTTSLDIAKLRELLAKTTAGEWNVQDFTDVAVNSGPTAADITVCCSWPDHIPVASMTGGLEGAKGPRSIAQARDDAAFIAAAKNAMGELLDRLERAEAALGRAMAEKAKENSDGR